MKDNKEFAENKKLYALISFGPFITEHELPKWLSDLTIYIQKPILHSFLRDQSFQPKKVQGICLRYQIEEVKYETEDKIVYRTTLRTID